MGIIKRKIENPGRHWCRIMTPERDEGDTNISSSTTGIVNVKKGQQRPSIKTELDAPVALPNGQQHGVQVEGLCSGVNFTPIFT
ncbi:hypothetical protein Pmani_007300 [Petrolisthes manimaculis]|uniref:Uncharacterized protein n=1 Tax=Petrolisthes manimaculis TaxID=1843537 RepID=A0AAE1UEZ5_9EUCA|nr:hypothetical protein Pmani_007300 [Petrolisthes manimaculis]